MDYAADTPKPKTQEWITEVLLAHGDDCVLWPFAKNTWGYGKLSYKGQWWGAHRFICQLVHGPAPFEGALALHSCGKGHHGCVNPKHLRWGTAKDNTADAVKAGTLGAGEINANSKLTDDGVRHMRQLHVSGKSYRSIATQFGVTDKAARMAIRGETWAHVQ